MRIGIIGAGHVGGTLGRRWAAAGHEVVFGLREGRGAKEGELPAGTRAASVSEAVQGADVVVLATPWGAVRDAIAGAGALDGTIVVDATNPLGPGLSLDHGPRGESGAEQIAAMAPRARVVKAFNTTGFNNMADPLYGGEPTVMFYAGDDAEAKRVVRSLVEALGFDAVDVGGLARSRSLEHIAVVWIALATGGMGREIAFKLARR